MLLLCVYLARSLSPLFVHSFYISFFSFFVLVVRISHYMCSRFPSFFPFPHTLTRIEYIYTHKTAAHPAKKQQILTGRNKSNKIEIARESSNPIKSKFMLFWWVLGLKIWNNEISFKRRLKHMTFVFSILGRVPCFALLCSVVLFYLFISVNPKTKQQPNIPKNKRITHSCVNQFNGHSACVRSHIYIVLYFVYILIP